MYRYKVGNLITSNDLIKASITPDGVCQLTISSTTNEDTGLYTIEVSNEAGINKADASGTVSGAICSRSSFVIAKNVNRLINP